MPDFDRYEERAAILEFDAGMSRFAAETEAARAQGLTRWQMMEAIRADGSGDIGGSRDRRPSNAGKPADHVPGMQPRPAQEVGSLPQRKLQA